MLAGVWLVTLTVLVRSVLPELHVGCAINIFSRFGYMGISMRVVPRNDSDRSWIFREPTVDIFRNISAKQSTKRSSGVNQTFDGDFHMEFCDNLKQLLQAYFRDFAVERLERPWHAFTGSWSKTALARNLGINTTYVTGDHCYVLVRVSRHREVATMADGITLTPDQVTLQDAVAKHVDAVHIGDSSSVVDFVKSFGSHYVTAYTTGNSLYQVFVFSPPIFRRIKEKLKKVGVSNLTNSELLDFFSPWYAEHTGTIQVASGNSTVEQWAADHLQHQIYFFTYPSLLKLREDIKLLSKLDQLLGNEALLKLDLRTLAPAFKDPAKRNWFHEVMDNHLKLWEVNM